MHRIEDMDLEQFVTWSAGVIIIRLGSGEKLQSTMWEILNNFLLHWLPSHGWQRIPEKKSRRKKEKK